MVVLTVLIMSDVLNVRMVVILIRIENVGLVEGTVVCVSATILVYIVLNSFIEQIKDVLPAQPAAITAIVSYSVFNATIAISWTKAL